ncbi:glycosyl hydrolase family 61 [Colletotrichum graminicola M1.001]|uniref:lytic cellulose monooxygenase (C4-dehydrogenating) n=1 Tax=Colletotrichum graminicola (strain M1.001 / M2 / FGSC 10212) TaxID=645133 RepID=E3QHM5_COLGM|nr:glycosyl hydrolase family 61 [Colletotrichum graminicola M1.001]EFQ30363.1 glycosyl hydrolase family 61 [Colletotrichum graminicola M1.001]
MRRVVIIFAGLTGLALGNSRVLNFVVNGASYQGFNPHSTTPKVLAAWGTWVKNDGWAGTESYGKPDIVCHTNATNAQGHVPFTAGTTIGFQWQGWPESHHGPVLTTTYLAYCGEEAGSCEAADKTRLNFFAIDKFCNCVGNMGDRHPIRNNASWTVQIPPKVVPGHYVLRHEIIALHYARDSEQGAQHYPQCINIEIAGEGNDKPSGTLGTDLHRPAEEGLLYDISHSPTGTYNIPGPTVYAGATAFVSQIEIVVKSSATAIPCDAVSTGT